MTEALQPNTQDQAPNTEALRVQRLGIITQLLIEVRQNQLISGKPDLKPEELYIPDTIILAEE